MKQDVYLFIYFFLTGPIRIKSASLSLKPTEFMHSQTSDQRINDS